MSTSENENSRPAAAPLTAAPLTAASLTAVQRWLQAVIMNPDGVEAGLASAAAQEQISVEPRRVEEVISRSQNQTSVERLRIYADAYYSRLLECLGEEFPILKQTLGDETFDAFALEYLQQYPSRSYTLNELGANFARYLEETRPPSEDTSSGDADSIERKTESAPDWPEFLIDLARMEWTFSVVFDGPGTENQPPLTADSLVGLTDEQLSTAHLELAPCVKLLALRFPLNGYYTASRAGESPPLPPPRASWLAVSRREFIVRRHELAERQFVLLSALAAGDTVGAAIEQAAAGLPATADASDMIDSLESLATALGEWFRQWSADGFFTQVIR